MDDISNTQGKQRIIPTPDDPDFLVTLPTLCKILKLPLKWTRRAAKSKEIPSYRIGHRRLFNVEAVKDTLIELAE